MAIDSGTELEGRKLDDSVKILVKLDGAIKLPNGLCWH